MSAVDPTGSSETELKFQLGQSALETLSRHPVLSTPGRRQRLRSVYFDTPEHDLRNRGFSLRVREKDGVFVQTLKGRSGNGVFDRGEWEVDVASDQPNTEVFADTPAAEILNGAADRLAPVFETCVERTVRIWQSGDTTVEVAVDEGEVIAADQRTPLSELELELKGGAPAALFDLAGELAREAPMTLSFQTKAERGYRLAGHEGAAAIQAERSAVTGKTAAETAFRQIARDCLSQIAGNAELLGRARSPRLVHQTRVGLRRLRAALSIFRPILDAEGLARAKAETKWLASELDPVRDIDVFAETYFGEVDDGGIDDPNLAALHQRVVEAQAAAHQAAVKAVQSQRFSDLLLDVSRWVEVGAWTRNADPEVVKVRTAPISAYGAARLEHLRSQVKKKGRRLVHREPDARHKLRLKVKKLRYAVEFFSHAFKVSDTRRRRYTELAKDLQDALGELNDLATARATVARIVGPRASELAFTAGRLVGARQESEPKMLQRARKACKAVGDAEPFWV